ncbi:CCC motif membrane protein [Chryseobacterium sp. GMJ5]|uniref:CCC motif membrane protein n=1 Tax=Chryseobacterium gilvum TaxID=2976534 RepID=A0ABT2W183_9FLAO|nr:CCC motif membrane protein [Chryseobacterium gilvum]MCU7614987.1 CCC motif membrane protein [Chryseobacterium gilvum]
MNQQNLPNATAVLVLGIFSIVGCCCYGVPGIIAGIIGLVLYNKDKTLYLQNPSQYLNYSNLNTGRILCIIGLALSALNILCIIILIATGGWEAYMQQMNELKNMGR